MPAILRFAIRPLAVLGALAALAVAGLNVAQATDRPGFCNTCHEMQPFHEAWAEGPHSGVDCVACHVEPGTVARLKHKFVALQEVRAHLFGDPRFPLEEPPAVPDSRCVTCHTDVDTSTKGFSHDLHASKGACVSCHAAAGHEVETEALSAAGVWSGRTSVASEVGTLPAPGAGAADIANHKKVDCSSCHVMSTLACSRCHTPKHPARGECVKCHAPGAKFVFTHPVDSACQTCHKEPKPDHARAQTCSTCHLKPASWAFTHPASAACETCHARPARHNTAACASCHTKAGVSWAASHPTGGNCETCHSRPRAHRAGTCATCHKRPGVTWAFAHPGSGVTCTSCHARPAGHSGMGCTTCHGVGKTWAFRHPGSGSRCATCHARPAGHSGMACTTCHGVGTSWTFRHPGSGSACASCHARPSGHSAAACATCHRGVGKSWAFSHPSSTACSSCHRAPSNHYGTSCVSCHSPSRAWSSATFSHPSIPGGEHTYRSFACSNCHPSGYSSATCVRCHENGSPDDDD